MIGSFDGFWAGLGNRRGTLTHLHNAIFFVRPRGAELTADNRIDIAAPG